MSNYRIKELDIAFLLLLASPLIALVPVIRFALSGQFPSINSKEKLIINLSFFTIGLIVAPIVGFILALRNRAYRPVIIIGSLGVIIAFLALLGNLGFLNIIPPSLNQIITIITGTIVVAYIPLAIIFGILYLVRRAKLIGELSSS